MSPKSTSQERAYEYLRTSVLVDPQYQGTFLGEQEIAESVGVSRTPVREALRRLNSEGLVELIPNRGAFVPRISASQISDLFEMRETLECFAAQKCLERDQDPTPMMLDALLAQEALCQQETFDHSAQLHFIALDRNFHLALLHAAANTEIVGAYERLETRQRVIGASALHDPLRRTEVCSEHRLILEALQRKDIAEAKQAITAHLKLSEAIMLNALFR